MRMGVATKSGSDEISEQALVLVKPFELRKPAVFIRGATWKS